MGHHRRQKLGALAAAAALAVLCLTTTPSAQAQERPRSNSSLYYRIGGGDPAARAGNANSLSMRLGIGGTLRLNYSCGRFDLGTSWQNLMNGFSQLGTTITNAVRAGISALPLYILQRAQPGLYQLFQTYSQKADVMIAAALKSCEEMEAQIKAGGDPYEEWIRLAKGDAWKIQANAGGDLLDAKFDVERNAGRQGLNWIGGQRAGGANQRAIMVVQDLVTAGYNATMNQPVLAAGNTDYVGAPPVPALAQTRLARSFRRPQDAARYAIDVVGEMQVALCDTADCAPKGTATGFGLGPKFEAEVPAVEAALTNMVTAARPDYTNLDAASAPGVAMGREVVEALRELPELERNVAVQRLAKEVALARTIDKALVIRNILLTGMTLPEVTAATAATAEAQKKVSILNRYVDDLLFENRVRKEVVSSTAQALLDAYRQVQAQSTSTGAGRRGDGTPVRDGRVAQ